MFQKVHTFLEHCLFLSYTNLLKTPRRIQELQNFAWSLDPAGVTSWCRNRLQQLLKWNL